MTLFEKLQAAGLPVLSATEDGKVQMGPMTPEQEEIYNDIMLEHFQPAVYEEMQTHRLDVQQIKAEYVAAIARLQQIENATNPTNAQVINAIRDMARYQRLVLKLLRRQYNGELLGS